MKLRSFGCSFIFGSDLTDAGHGQVRAVPSKLTWPSLLSQKLNIEYECYARPGAGNLQILERLLTALACNEYGLYVIGWTWIDRFDYNNPANDQWRTIMPIDTDDLAKMYYRDLHSQYRDKLTTISYIKLAIHTLEQKGYPFIMTFMDNLIFENKWHTTPAITDAQSFIEPHMTTFEGDNFLNWSKKKGFAISKTLHPLEPAHFAAADLLFNTCNTLKSL